MVRRSPDLDADISDPRIGSAEGSAEISPDLDVDISDPRIGSAEGSAEISAHSGP